MDRTIEAAGGIVKNSNGEYLFIFRNGKWDLPKGKIEKGEKIEDAAIREVEEECGIKELKIVQQIQTTFHTYILDGNEILKKTYWFAMKTTDKSKLIPQLEEGITKAKWLKSSELEIVRKNTFSNILELIKSI